MSEKWELNITHNEHRDYCFANIITALSLVSKSFFPLPKPHLSKVICEDTEDEKDLIGIWGVHWKEMDQTEFLLKEIFDKSLTDASHQTDSANHDDVISDIELGDNKTDAESDVDLDGNHRLGGDGNTQDESFELRKPPTVLPLCVGALDRKDDVWAHLPKSHPLASIYDCVIPAYRSFRSTEFMYNLQLWQWESPFVHIL
ncbi:hypothetical protein P692DRAFT_201806993 [Suillus brevipes Sb2]|nr:hypothetical protein P692DRAFT_201806993 [Suillus brevipes Sb2]